MTDHLLPPDHEPELPSDAEVAVAGNIAGDSAGAIAFLKQFHTNDLWCLTAIHPDTKKIEAISFELSEADAAFAWIEKRNGNSNLYFSVNPLLQKMSKKAKASDVARLSYLHVDVDPRVLEGGMTLEDEQARILALFNHNLPVGVPEPTVVVFSGGGYQAFWKLAKPVELDGTEEAAEAVKLYNKKLELDFGGDHCHNIDRIMRLPGTINVPDEKKRKKGRKPALAKVVQANWDNIYPLDTFAAAKAETKPVVDVDVHVDGNVARLKDLSELDPWNVPERLKTIIEKGFHPDENSKPHDDRSRWVFDVACGLAHCKVPDDVIYSILTDKRFAISAHVLDQKNSNRCARKMIADAKKAVGDDDNSSGGDTKTLPPLQLARKFLHKQPDPLLRYASEWFTYRNGVYMPRDDETIRGAVYQVFPDFRQSNVSNVLDAAKSLVLKDSHDFTPPCWLDGRQAPKPSEQLVVRNGMVDMGTGELSEHNAQFFTFNALGYDYDPDAPKPERWLKFVNEVFHEDSIELVQQICGYLLTPDTSRQAIFVFVGVSGSGKSTFGRVLEGILGPTNVCSPSLSGLGSQFGQQVLIGKQLAVISEMKLDHRDNKEAVARVLLNISGEDPVAIPRKNRTDWEGRLGTRFVILANTPPTLSDTAGALQRRYIMIEMPTSFVGREDPGLEEALLEERSGILKWCIEGRKNLPRRFVNPASSADLIAQVDRLGSPVKAFVADQCVFEVAAVCPKDEVYQAYVRWHQERQMRDMTLLSKEHFSAKLLEAHRDKVKSVHPSQKVGMPARPPRSWRGIRLLCKSELLELEDEGRFGPRDEDIPF